MPLDSGGMERHAEISISRRWLCGAKRIRQTSGSIDLPFPESFVDTPASISSSSCCLSTPKPNQTLCLGCCGTTSELGMSDEFLRTAGLISRPIRMGQATLQAVAG